MSVAGVGVLGGVVGVGVLAAWTDIAVVGDVFQTGHFNFVVSSVNGEEIAGGASGATLDLSDVSGDATVWAPGDTRSAIFTLKLDSTHSGHVPVDGLRAEAMDHQGLSVQFFDEAGEVYASSDDLSTVTANRTLDFEPQQEKTLIVEVSADQDLTPESTAGVAWTFVAEQGEAPQEQEAPPATPGLSYTTSGGTATVTGPGQFSGGDLVVPATVEISGQTYPVTRVGNSAFRDRNLSSVTLLGSVTDIGDYAFYNSRLTRAELPDSVTTIGRGAFYANALTSVTIPDSVTTIGIEAFRQNSLDRLTIPASVTHIGNFAFNVNNLAQVEFQGRVPINSADRTSWFRDNSPELVLSYPWGSDSSQVDGGFTSPTWQGYKTQRGEAP